MILNPQLKHLIEQSPQTFERYVIHAFIHSSRFYLAYRDSICPWREEGTWRRDFATSRYNDLFPAIDLSWQAYSDLGSYEDFGLDKPMLMAAFADRANAGGIDVKGAQQLMEEIESDFYRPDWNVNNIIKLVSGPGLEFWLGLRLTKQLANKIHNSSQLGFMTPDDVQMAVAGVRKQMVAVQSSTAVNMGDVMMGTTKYMAVLPTGIPKLDAALGGGYARGTATMIAGINAGGKSCLATQAVWNAIKRDENVLFVTTEEPPSKIAHRIIANASNTPISEFVVRRDAVSTGNEEVDVMNVPELMWNDPAVADKLRQIHEKMLTHCCCLDWSQGQGYTIPGNLDTEIDKLVASGWSPSVIVFDWIGGGLGAATDKDKVRHLYQEAADHLVNHSKRTKRIVIAMAQLDKSQASGKKRTTMKMLSECKTMTNNFVNFIGLSALIEADVGGASDRNLSINQFFNVEKARYGPGGLVPVEAHFKFQRFVGKNDRLHGGT